MFFIYRCVLILYVFCVIRAAISTVLCVCVCVALQETGFWFIFHHVPTGPSEGMYSPGKSEHTPMGLFINNRAHSNYRVSVCVCACVVGARHYE